MAFDLHAQEPAWTHAPARRIATEEQFANEDAPALYASMRPDQRTAIAYQFLRLYRLARISEAERLVIMPSSGDRMLAADQVAILHEYARDFAPVVLAQVWQHPVTQAVLAAPGAAPVPGTAAEPVDVTPAEHIMTLGPRYLVGGTMMGAGTGRTAELCASPHEWVITPLGGSEPRIRVGNGLSDLP